jgi:oligopeptide/dipeptide ABC transporter ATP-binding protein
MTAPHDNLLLEVRDLRTEFATDEGLVRAVDGVSFSVTRGKVVALVGESGCGKSVTALSIMRLIPSPPGRIASGQVLFHDAATLDLVTLPESQMRRLRGNRIAMIFQEPMTSLNPVYTIGDQIVEAIELHQHIKGKPAWSRAAEMLRKVGIPAPERRVHEYPHQLSGGMRQRVMIAMALACNPSLLIADEPTTALDVTIQAQILDLLRALQQETGMSILIITHDLGVVAEIADEVVVMYAGKVVERADVHELFAHPLHPYTQGLLRCMPRLRVQVEDPPRRGSEFRVQGSAIRRLDVIPGAVPNPLDFPPGCRFHPRCPVSAERAARGDRPALQASRAGEPVTVLKRCVELVPEGGGDPPLREHRPRHFAACWEIDTDPTRG